MNISPIYAKQKSTQNGDTRKVDTQVQQAFLNILYEKGILSDKVHSLAMRKISEGV